ncbi:MAG: hypothetical protein ACREJB_11970, partial [Planctomycetaceae bacterium]
MQQDSDSESAERGSSSPLPDWLTQAATPREGFWSLLQHLSRDLSTAPQAEKIAAFRDGIDAIGTHLGELTITAEFRTSFPGT